MNRLFRKSEQPGPGDPLATRTTRGADLLARCLLALCCVLGARVSAAETSKPNIVLILADDLGYGDVRCLNPLRGKILTPSLDRVASQGMRFTDAHSGASVCTPTRYGILTGRYAWRTRLQRGVLSDYVQPLIAVDRLTLPALLQQHDYHTACIGKWHLGFTLEPPKGNGGQEPAAGAGGKRTGAPLGAVTLDGPTTRGFDFFYGYHHARTMKSVFENDRVTQLIEPVDMLPTLTRRATAYVAQRAGTGQPFFLYLALNSPHTPIVPSRDWQGRSGLGDYGDFVMETDWAVGEVLAAIDQAGIAENTMVVFTSDNGCSPAAKVHELEQQGHFPSAQFRGYKADIWEGGHRVPFLVRWPARVKAGSASDRLICLTDFMGTCVELLGATLPENAGEDGVSFLPTLLGEATQGPREAVVHHSINGKFSVRRGPWKLELCAGSGGWGHPRDAQAIQQGLPAMQLYHLDEDIAEQRNLESRHPEVVQALHALLERYVTDGRSTPGADQKNDVPVELPKIPAADEDADD